MASDPTLEALRLWLSLDPHGARARLDDLVALYERNAAHYAAFLIALEALPLPPDFADRYGNAHAVLAAEHHRFVYLADNARAFRAGLAT